MSAQRDDEAAVRALLRQAVSMPAVDPRRAAGVRQAVHAAWRERSIPRRRWARAWWAGAAAAVVLAALALSSRVHAPTPIERSSVAPAVAGTVLFVAGRVTAGGVADARASAGVGDTLRVGTEIDTSAGGYMTLALLDGVEVRLDRDSAIVVTAGRQIALTRGALYLDTTPRRGPAVPIEVTAADAIIRDIGTRYEVRRLDGALRVRVRDGRVQVRQGTAVQETSGGESVTVAGGQMRVAAASPFGPDWAWVVRASRPPHVNGRTLDEFLAWVRREDGRTIRFEDASLEQAVRSTTVYGTIDGLGVEEALDVVLPSCGLTHRIDGAVITIVASETRGAR